MPARPADSGSKCAGSDNRDRFVISSSSFSPQKGKDGSSSRSRAALRRQPTRSRPVAVSRDFPIRMYFGRIAEPNAAEACEIIEYG